MAKEYGFIEALIFDLGNVLIDFDHTIAAKRISKFCKKTPKEIYDLFFESPVTVLFEEGKIQPKEFFAEVRNTLDLNMSFESFTSIWNDIFFSTRKNREVFSLINSLRQNYKTALLTNVNVLHFEYLEKSFPVFGVFHAVLPSFKIHHIKPAKEIYIKALESLRVDPERVFYTDDRKELVESANALGIKGFVFKGVPQLKKDLLSLGIRLG